MTGKSSFLTHQRCWRTKARGEGSSRQGEKRQPPTGTLGEPSLPFDAFQARKFLRNFRWVVPHLKKLSLIFKKTIDAGNQVSCTSATQQINRNKVEHVIRKNPGFHCMRNAPACYFSAMKILYPTTNQTPNLENHETENQQIFLHSAFAPARHDDRRHPIPSCRQQQLEWYNRWCMVNSNKLG